MRSAGVDSREPLPLRAQRPIDMTALATALPIARDAVVARRLRFVFDQTRAAIVTSALGAAATVAVFWDVTPAGILLAWLASYALVGGARYWLIARFRGREAAWTALPQRLFIGLTFAAGLAWGLMPVLFAPPDAPLLQALALVWTAGMAAAAMVAYAAVLPVAVAFIVPSLVPVLVIATFGDGVLLQPAVGICVALFLGYGLLVTTRISRQLERQFELEQDNAALLARLENDSRRILQLNERLATDLERHRRTAHELEAARAAAERLSSTDGLTGIANRRSFDEALAQEWARALRKGTSLALLMCDLDRFKEYNDTHGHPAGDRCLQRAAAVLAQQARRPGDVAARYGGEEFVLLLPETSLEDACAIAEDLRARIRAPGGAADPPVTASLGVAALVPQRTDPPALLVTRADAALYQAKRHGRDRVAHAPPGD